MSDLKRVQELVRELDVLVRHLSVQTASTVPDNRPKLTKREVKALREHKRKGGWSNSELAALYDVNPSTVSRIVRGQYHK